MGSEHSLRSGQHNSHIVNQAHNTVPVVITDKDNRSTTQILEKFKVTCVSSAKGSVTVYTGKFATCEIRAFLKRMLNVRLPHGKRANDVTHV